MRRGGAKREFLFVVRPIVVGGDEFPVLAREVFFFGVGFDVVNASPDFGGCIEQDVVGAGADDWVVFRYFWGEAEAQALADTLGEIVPHLLRPVFVGSYY